MQRRRKHSNDSTADQCASGRFPEHLRALHGCWQPWHKRPELIDELELKTRVVTLQGTGLGVNVVSYTADDDLTLRQAVFSTGTIFLSSDSSKVAAVPQAKTDEFLLSSTVSRSYSFLAFPLRRGETIYCSFPGVASPEQATLVFT